MTILNKYLIVIYICLTLTYVTDILELKDDIDSIIPQLMMLAFVNISVWVGFFSKKWFGQLLLYSNFLLVGLVPLFFGVVSCWVNNRIIKEVFKVICVGIPLLILIVPFIGYLKGNAPDNWEPSFRIVFYRLIQAGYWFAVYMYASMHLKQELEKIEKAA